MAVKIKRNTLVDVMEEDSRGGLGLATYVQDQTTPTLNLYFIERKYVGGALALPTTPGGYTVTLTSGHGLTTGNSLGYLLQLTDETTGRFYRGTIAGVAGDIVTLGSMVGDTFSIENTEVTAGNTNLCKDSATGIAINGSITPVVFDVRPKPAQIGDITRIIVAITSSNEADLTTLGGAPALTKGLLLRVRRSDGSYRNIFNWRSNFDLAIHGFDTLTLNPKTGNSTRGYVSRITFAGQENHGVVIRLDGTLGEVLEVVVNDAMDATASGNTKLLIMAEGSVVQE